MGLRFFINFKWEDHKGTTALEVFGLLVLSTCGLQPQNNWTVQVWRRQWFQFGYLIRCGASCLLVKSRQGFHWNFFFVCLSYITEESQPKGEQMSEMFHYRQLLNLKSESILNPVFQAVLQGWLSFRRPIQIKLSRVSVCCNDSRRNHRTVTQWQCLRSFKRHIFQPISHCFILFPLQNDQMAVQFCPARQLSGCRRILPLARWYMIWNSPQHRRAELQRMFPFLSTQCTISHAWPEEKQPARLPWNWKKKKKFYWKY